MTAGRVLGIILGVLVIIGGIYCLMTPVATYESLAWLLGVVMLADGVVDTVTWFQIRRGGQSSVWPLIGAIVSIVLGIILVFSFVAQMAVSLFMAYLLAIWLIVGGITRMMLGWNIRSTHRMLNTQFFGRNWWVMFLLGILLVIVGVLSIFDPLGLMATIGIFIGVAIIFMGIGVIGMAL